MGTTYSPLPVDKGSVNPEDGTLLTGDRIKKVMVFKEVALTMPFFNLFAI